MYISDGTLAVTKQAERGGAVQRTAGQFDLYSKGTMYGRGGDATSHWSNGRWYGIEGGEAGGKD